MKYVFFCKQFKKQLKDAKKGGKKRAQICSIRSCYKIDKMQLRVSIYKNWWLEIWLKRMCLDKLRTCAFKDKDFRNSIARMFHGCSSLFFVPPNLLHRVKLRARRSRQLEVFRNDVITNGSVIASQIFPGLFTSLTFRYLIIICDANERDTTGTVVWKSYLEIPISREREQSWRMIIKFIDHPWQTRRDAAAATLLENVFANSRRSLARRIVFSCRRLLFAHPRQPWQGEAFRHSSSLYLVAKTRKLNKKKKKEECTVYRN